ncbi:hypothetical protein [Lentzea sp. E54]|uniref:hypothetical protein n=1 Tax=Lentzea xerophila TaxID=3435883 RepID=UPI003DA62F6E
MTGERTGRAGLGQAAAGTVFGAWVVVFAAVAEAGNRQVLAGAAVCGGLVCLGAVAGGVVATRITDAASVARLRHVFVVLEGAALAIFFPFYWFAIGVEPVDRPGDFALVVVLALAVPVGVALVLVLRRSFAVHAVVVGAFGPLVPDGDGAPVGRIRVLGTVLITAGAALSVAAGAVAFTAPLYRPLMLAVALLVTLTPVLLGLRLARVTDLHSARRVHPGSYVIVPAACGFAVSEFASEVAAAGMLFGALVFGAVVLVVIAMLMVREFTGEWDQRQPGRVSR